MSTTDSLPPRIQGANGLGSHPVQSSLLVAILAGLLLQMYNIIELLGFLDSVLPDHHVGARLIYFSFRMAMGVLLVLVAIPLLHGFLGQSRWLTEYRGAMRVSMGPQPKRTLAVTLLCFLALIGVLTTFSIGAGVFAFDPGVLVNGDNWLVLLVALVPGFWEELTFRGLILTNLQRRFSPRVAVVVSAVVFGLFHFSNLLGNWDDATSVAAGAIAATTLGLGWGYVVIKTNSIVPTILLHYLVDVILFDELFLNPQASDDSTSIVYLAFAILYPLLTVMITRQLCNNTQPGPSHQ